jgi:hypothetical protein
MYRVVCECGHVGVVGRAWLGRVLACTACGGIGLPQQCTRIIPTRNATPMVVDAPSIDTNDNDTTDKQTENQNDNAQAI